MKPELENLIAQAAKLGRSAAEAMATVGARLQDVCDAADRLRSHGPDPEKRSTRKRGKAAPRATQSFSGVDSEKAAR